MASEMSEHIERLLSILRPLLDAREGPIAQVAAAAERGDPKAVQWACDRLTDLEDAGTEMRAIIAAGTLTATQLADELGIGPAGAWKRMRVRGIAGIPGPNPGRGPAYVDLIPRGALEQLR